MLFYNFIPHALLFYNLTRCRASTPRALLANSGTVGRSPLSPSMEDFPKQLHPFILPWYLLTLHKGTKKKVRQKNKKGPQKNHIIMFWVRRKMERKLERTQTNAPCVRSRNPMAPHGELRKPVQTGLTSAITISFSPVSIKGKPKTTKNTNLNERPNLIIPLHQ